MRSDIGASARSSRRAIDRRAAGVRYLVAVPPAEVAARINNTAPTSVHTAVARVITGPG